MICAFLGFSWLAMQVVHELGHVSAAWATGGRVSHVALHPLTISRTDVGLNPQPLVVVWSGAIVGAFFPLIIFVCAWAFRAPGLYLFRFFAGFCLVANGVYIGSGWFESMRTQFAADSSVILMNGSPLFTLAVFGLVTIPLGFFLWHRQGRHFGFSVAEGRVNPGAVAASVILFLAVILIEVIVNSR